MKKLLMLLMLVMPAVSYSASFDCTKARSKVEKAICADPELSQLDEDMASAYKIALKTHPVPESVKARQIEWLSFNKYCDAKKFNECLKANYRKRTSDLEVSKTMLVFSSNKKFSQYAGDMVVEIVPETGKITIWGGFAQHNQASRDQGKPVYTGCEFEGVLKDKTMTSAIGNGGSQIFFRIKNNEFELDDKAHEHMCGGFAFVPGGIKRVSK
jgi:uncharacterized protein